MKKKNQQFLFGVIIALLASFTTANTQKLRLMTYNIRLDVASDGVNAWPNRRDDLAAQVLFYNPDILGTQEGLPTKMSI